MKRPSDTACLQVGLLSCMPCVCNASCYSGEILEVSAFFVHSNSSYRRWIGGRVMGVEDSFRKIYKPYSRVVWKVDSHFLALIPPPPPPTPADGKQKKP